MTFLLNQRQRWSENLCFLIKLDFQMSCIICEINEDKMVHGK